LPPKPPPIEFQPGVAGRRPTVDDVARLAGVSTATISRALNSPELVAEATIKRVQDAVRATGYVPNLLAGGLASSRSRLVAAIVPEIAGSIFNPMIEAMCEELAAAGYLVLLGLSGRRDEHLARVVPQILARRPDGIILTAEVTDETVRAQLRASGAAIVQTWDLPADPIATAIGFSHDAVGRGLAEFARSRGYRSAHVVTTGLRRALVRLHGFEAAFGGKVTHEVVGDFATLEKGRSALAGFLDGGGKADLILCSADVIAHGVLLEAAARGLKVPGDLAVCGFGGLDFTAATAPPLTTVAIDGRAIGRRAVEVLLDRAAGRPPSQALIDIGYQIIARESA
jgi:LacI family gluconate utilization system Gnt-I transcriptional repressor